MEAVRAGMLIVKIRDDSSSRDNNSNSSRNTSNSSRNTSNSSRNSQLEHQATAAVTIGTLQTSTAGGRPATARLPEIVEIS